MPNPDVWINQLPKLASVIVVIAIAFSVTQLIWLFLFKPPAETSDTALPAIPTIASRPDENYAQSVEQFHLFGTANIVAEKTDVVAQTTSLNLKLIGLWSTGESDGYAIISSGGNDEKVYGIGDKVPGNATVKAIYPDRVILETSRGLEKLELPREAMLISFGSDAVPGAAAMTTEEVDNQYESGDTDNPQAAGGEPSFAEYRRQFIRNPASIAEYAQVQPGEVNGEFKGYKLKLLKDDPVFGSLGLQEDDIITAVNGLELNKPENGIKALRMLMKAQQVQATVLRNGQEVNMSINLN